MQTQSDLLALVITCLNNAELDYMVVGSMAAAAHGMERITHDLDIVVQLLPESVPALAEALGDVFYLDVESAMEAAERRDMFNAIHFESGFKVDFWVLKTDAFSHTQFSRKKQALVMGVPCYVESPEDTILSKLLWYRITPSDRQLDDVRGIIEVQRKLIDWDYVRTQAIRAGVADLLEPLLSKP